ncbi:MAG: NAD(P)/FAD-dependent oxidoreductase [Chitinophagales bacterium]
MLASKQKNLFIPESKLPRLIIIGGGFAGINLAKKLIDKPVQIVMIDRHNYHTFQPLLYQVATAGLEPDSIAEPLRKIIDHQKDFYFRMAPVREIDPAKNMVITDSGFLTYDHLVIACGTVSNYFGNEEIQQRAFPLKQIPHALDLRSHILQNFEKAVLKYQDNEDIESLLNIVIVGGGPTGVEVAGALAELRRNVLPGDYPELDFDKMNIYLVEGMDRLLGGMSDEAGSKAVEYLEQFGVEVMLETMVKNYDGLLVDMGDKGKIKSNTLIWAAGVKGNIIRGLDKAEIEGNRYVVDEYHCVIGHDNIYAVGDVALMKNEEYPKGHPQLAQVAIQQGRHLADNLGNLFSGKKQSAFKYRHKGAMATIGRNKAVVDLPGNWRFGGLLAWIIWMGIHLLSLVGFRNKMVVFGNWVWNYFTYDRSIRLIIRPLSKKDKRVHK